MTISLPLDPGGKPKRDIIEMAFEDCGTAGFEFERTPEEVGSALRKLNAMMLEWPWDQLGYAQPDYGSGLPEDESGIPGYSLSAVASYLALRIAPTMGKTLSNEQRTALARSLGMIQSKVAAIPQTPFAPNTPRGMGATWSGRAFFSPFINEEAVTEA